MATADTVHAPKLGEPGESCSECGTPLAEDQRYCLNCGHRRTEARVPFMEVLASTPGGPAPPDSSRAAPAPAPAGPPSRVTPLAAVTAVSAVVVALAAGVVIGHQDEGGSGKAQVITVGAGAGTGTAAAASPTTEFQADWPAGKNGWTVQLRALPKEGTQPAAVAAAKSDAESKGAKDVGALDSDEYQSLDPGRYVVYSGVFTKKADAAKALKGLKGKFKGATVVQVSTGPTKGDPDALSGKKKEATVDRSQLEALQKLSPSEYQKKSNKLPDTTKLPGAPPPTDNKAPGGGSGGQVIK